MAFLNQFNIVGEDLVGDFNDDDSVSTADLLAFLGAFGSTSEGFSEVTDVEINFDDALQEVTYLTWLVRLGLFSGDLNEDLKRIKTIYSRYPEGAGEGTKVRGRFLEVECETSSLAENHVFGIEVDYDVDIKSSTTSTKSAARRRTKRR